MYAPSTARTRHSAWVGTEGFTQGEKPSLAGRALRQGPEFSTDGTEGQSPDSKQKWEMLHQREAPLPSRKKIGRRTDSWVVGGKNIHGLLDPEGATCSKLRRHHQEPCREAWPVFPGAEGNGEGDKHVAILPHTPLWVWCQWASELGGIQWEAKVGGVSVRIWGVGCCRSHSLSQEGAIWPWWWLKKKKKQTDLWVLLLFLISLQTTHLLLPTPGSHSHHPG